MILNSPNIIREVKSRWLLGESVFGGAIGGKLSSANFGEYRSSEYKAFKISYNPQASGRVDLTLTGALGAGLNVKKNSSTIFQVLSADSKYSEIGNKYGFEEFGLSDSEWITMQDEILAFALETIIKKTYE